MVPDVGKQITCLLICTGGNANEAKWSVRTVRYLREYPDSAYEFSYEETANVPGFMISYDVNWAISGNVDPFAIFYNRTPDYSWTAERYVGPATIRVWKASNEDIHPTAWAHPDPNKRFDPDTWELNNWIEVARKS